jgi:hypothetical protein
LILFILNMKKSIVLLVFFSLCLQVKPQYKIGQWVDYLPYNSVFSVTRGNGKVYAATGVGVFAVNGADNSYERMNKIYGLNDVEAILVRFNPHNNTLMIVYSNSNIDVIKGETITNFSDIQRKSISGDKSINNISFYKEFAYLSCGFGIVVFDTERMEFKDTYIIGNLGGNLKIYDVARNADTIYAATGSGLKQAVASSNLANYQNWSDVPGLPSGVYNNVVKMGSSFFANFSANLTSGTQMADQMFWRRGGNWINYPKSPNGSQTYTVYRVLADESTNKITIADQWVLDTYTYVPAGDTMWQTGSFGGNLPFKDPDGNLIWPALKEGIYAPELGGGNFALATESTGLVKTDGTNHFQLIIDGPAKNYVSQMAIMKNKLVVAPVYLTEIWTNVWRSTGVYTYDFSSWKNIRKSPLNSVIDLNCVAFLNDDPNHYFAASWGDGLCEFRNDTLFNIHNESNSTLQPATTTCCSVRINGLASDTMGNLWVANAFTTKILSVRKPDASWQNFNFANYVVNSAIVGKVIIDRNNQKWIMLPSAGFLVFNDNGNYSAPNSSNTKKITTAAGSGGLPSSEVYSICEDKEGDMWIGTDKGIAVFYNPESILTSSSGWDCQQIIVDQNGIAKILLESETVFDIVVDGENRKWIATKNGVFCLSPDGQKEIYHFTEANSPLFADFVIDLEYNGKTGDIFFGTQKGIQSFRTEVIDPFEEFTDVYSYPNPVRPGYEGPIVIKGMVKDAVVKITDISGALVYETTSKGGQAIWYGKNYKGERVSSGVYVVFCASSDGEQKALTKILLVN